MLSAIYEGPLSPFYAGTHAYHWDPTLQLQAPRPGSHAWFDRTLTYQAERGGLGCMGFGPPGSRGGCVPLGADDPLYVTDAPSSVTCGDKASMDALIAADPTSKLDVVAGCFYRAWQADDVSAARRILSWLSHGEEKKLLQMITFDYPSASSFYRRVRPGMSRGTKIALGVGGLALLAGFVALARR